MATELQVKNTPAVRFRGFDDEWEQVKLGDVVDFYSGLTYSPNDVSDNGVFVLRSSNVKNGEIIDADNVYVDKSVVNSKYVEPDDIIVVVRNGSRNLIGKHATVKDGLENTVIGAFMTGIKSDTPFFINALLDSQQFEREIYKNLGATINQITTGNFKKMKFKTPSLEEQQKIGELFQTLDKAINLSNTQVENLKQQKKALLQRLFPQKGETAPNVRLRGFTDTWEEVTLGDVVDTSTGKLNANAMTDDGAYPFFTCSKDVYLTDTYSFDDEALIIAGNGDMGAVKYYSGKFDAYQRTYVLTKIKGDVKYLEYCLSVNLPRQIHSMTYGSTMPYITKPTLTDMSIQLPSLEEQQAIGELFQTLDEQISLAEDKVSQYKELKQALLQRLFV